MEPKEHPEEIIIPREMIEQMQEICKDKGYSFAVLANSAVNMFLLTRVETFNSLTEAMVANIHMISSCILGHNIELINELKREEEIKEEQVEDRREPKKEKLH